MSRAPECEGKRGSATTLATAHPGMGRHPVRHRDNEPWSGCGIGPFALAAALGATTLFFDPHLPSWAPPMMVAVSVLAMLGACLTQRGLLPRSAANLAPFVYLLGILVLLFADSDTSQERLVLAVLPLLWLALSAGGGAVVGGLALAVAAVVADTAASWPVPSDDLLHAGLLVVLGLCIVPAVHGLVAEVRRRTDDLDVLVHAAHASLQPASMEHAICTAAVAISGAAEARLVVGLDGRDPAPPPDEPGLRWTVMVPLPVDSRPVTALALGYRGRSRPISSRATLALSALAEQAATALLLHRNARKLAANEELFRDLADRSGDVVYRLELEPSPRLLYASPSVEEVSGYPAQAFFDDPGLIARICHPDDAHLLLAAPEGGSSRFDLRWTRSDGREVVTEHHVSKLMGGIGVQGVARDVTEVRRLQAELASMAQHDALTGLANRRLLSELAGPLVAGAERRGVPVVVAFVDLDGFKSVNDRQGHEAGDAVLVEVAARLRRNTRPYDVVARVGGDEFVVVFDRPPEGTTAFLERLTAVMEAPIAIAGDTTVVVGASIGTASTDVVPGGVDALLNAADTAMYAAKRARKAA